ncbi:MAG: PA14 domain-containing protein [Opitutaceae bacterium]
MKNASMISLSPYRSCSLVVLLLTASAGQILAQNPAVALPYEADFESTDGYTAGPLLSDSEWNLQPELSAEIFSFGAIGNQSLGFTGNYWLGLNSLGLNVGEVTWVDFYLQPVFADSNELLAAIPMGQSAVTGFVKLAAEGEVYVVDGDTLGSGQWLPSGERRALTGNSSEDWVRLTYRLDYVTKQWDLFVDGEMSMTDLGFLDNTPNQLTQFSMRGDIDDTSVFDYFYAGGENPLYVDTSNDGLPDDWLVAQGLGINGNQRSGDGDADGLDNLTEYKFNTRADLADTDGDGAEDGVEITAGVDPTDPDTDDDGALDGLELSYGSDPHDVDTDNDWVLDGPEFANGTDPLLFDTDGDNLTDSLEPIWGLDPLVGDTTLAALEETELGSGIFEWKSSFSAAEGYLNGASLGGQEGWSALGDVLVAAEQVDMTDSSTETSFERIAAVGETRRVWISFRAKLVVAQLPYLGTLSEPAVAVWAVANPDKISVWDEPTQEWLEFDAVDDVTEWNSYSLYFDYDEQEWLLTQNGILIASDLSFKDEDLIVFSRFKALQGISDDISTNTASFDDFVFSNTEPEGLDFDGDGLINSLEREVGANLFVEDTDQDGMGDLWEYIGGLNLLEDDTLLDADLDGMNNLDELIYGLNPQLADVHGFDGIVRRDLWFDLTGRETNRLTNHSSFPINPDAHEWITDLDVDSGDSYGNYYGQRIYGLIIAPEAGDYTFWIAGDDHCELWLSTDDTGFNKQRVAYLEVASAYQDWTRAETQKSELIPLDAGQAYFFEIIYKEHDGNDHVTIAWEFGANPRTVISGDYLRVHTPDQNDADADGLPDDWEAANGLDPAKGYGIDGYVGDPNFDGRLNYEERLSGTDPLNPDTDGDSFSNLVETKILDSDPFVAESNAYVVPEDFILTSINGYSGAEAVAYASATDPLNLYFGGAGAGFKGTYDGGQFLNQEVNGDFAITMQLNRASDDGDLEIALVARETLSGQSAFIGVNALFNTTHYRLYQRSAEAQGLNTIKLNFSENPTGQRWLRLERNDNTFSAYASRDGSSWTFVGSYSLELPDQLYVGALLATGSNTNLRGAEITFTQWETDLDRDGLSDEVELSLGTALDLVDTDGDGFSDYEEYIHLGTDPLVPNAISVSAPFHSLSGSATAASTGTWRSNDDGSIVSLDYRGSLTYDLDVQTSGFYRVDVAVREGNQYRDASQFRLLAYIDGVYVGDSLVTATPDEVSTVSFWLPWQGVGQPEITLDWIPVETGTSLRIDSIEMVTLEFDDQATADAWAAARIQDEFALPASGTVLSPISPYNVYGHAINLDMLSIVRDTDQQAFAPLRALSDTFHLDLPLSIEDNSDVFSVQSHSGIFTESLDIEWQVTNLADLEDLETPYLRLGDSLLLGWDRSQGPKPKYGTYIELFRVEAEVDLPETEGRLDYIDLALSANGGSSLEAYINQSQGNSNGNGNGNGNGNSNGPQAAHFQNLALPWQEDLSAQDLIDYRDGLNNRVRAASVESLLAEGLEAPWDFIFAERAEHSNGDLIPFTLPTRSYQAAGSAPSDSVLIVDGFGLDKHEVAAVHFDQPGVYRVRSTWLDRDDFVYESLLEVIVLDVDLGATIAAVVDFERVWQPTQLPVEVELEADAFISLDEVADTDPREFGVLSSQPVNGSIIARLPGTAAVAGVLDVNAISDYTRLFGGSQKIVEVFSDGTELLEITLALGGSFPDDFKIHLTPITAGVLFEDGSLDQWITADQLDELGRYKYRVTVPAETPSNGCHYYHFFQSNSAINDKI